MPKYLRFDSEGGPGGVISEGIEDIYPVPARLLGGQVTGTFLLNVDDDAMQPHIADGDWVVVLRRPDASDNAIVAAAHNGDAVVRVLRRADERTYLVALNVLAGLPDITVGNGPGEAVILGVVLASIHQF